MLSLRNPSVLLATYSTMEAESRCVGLGRAQMCRLVGAGCSEPSSNPSSELEHCGLTTQSSHLEHGDKVMHIKHTAVHRTQQVFS